MSNELTVREPPLYVADTMTLADTFVRSGFFADTKDAAQAVVKILAGRELGSWRPAGAVVGPHVPALDGHVASRALTPAAAGVGHQYAPFANSTTQTVLSRIFRSSTQPWLRR